VRASSIFNCPAKSAPFSNFSGQLKPICARSSAILGPPLAFGEAVWLRLGTSPGTGRLCLPLNSYCVSRTRSYQRIFWKDVRVAIQRAVNVVFGPEGWALWVTGLCLSLSL